MAVECQRLRADASPLVLQQGQMSPSGQLFAFLDRPINGRVAPITAIPDRDFLVARGDAQ
jgi:hypothetical protein